MSGVLGVFIFFFIQVRHHKCNGHRGRDDPVIKKTQGNYEEISGKLDNLAEEQREEGGMYLYTWWVIIWLNTGVAETEPTEFKES